MSVAFQREKHQENERNEKLISQLQEKVRSKEEKINILKSSDNNDRKVGISVSKKFGEFLKKEGWGGQEQKEEVR